MNKTSSAILALTDALSAVIANTSIGGQDRTNIDEALAKARKDAEAINVPKPVEPKKADVAAAVATALKDAATLDAIAEALAKRTK